MIINPGQSENYYAFRVKMSELPKRDGNFRRWDIIFYVLIPLKWKFQYRKNLIYGWIFYGL